MPNDYAVVLGLSRYPTLGEPPDSAADLNGPDNDADAVYAWLKSVGIPDENIKLRKSSQFTPFNPPDAGKPTRDEINECFVWLDQIAQNNKGAGKGLKVGRRLYVYASGHGFSPKRNQGCLFAANATPRYGVTSNVSSWFEWFQDANYFDELVLWMDCCMNRMSLLPPGDVPLVPIVSPNASGPAFIAFAAQRPLKAAEAPVPEDAGRVHGLFTWALLEGLRGAAVDEYGMVTSNSLANRLRNSLRPRMSPADLNDLDVSKEPDILREDVGLVFARGLAPRAYETTLTFSAGIGQQGRLWSGRPPRVSQTFTIEPAVQLSLAPPGLYLVDSPAAGLRQGLEVTGASSVAISETGAAVRDSTGSVFSVGITPAEPGTEIFVIDERFRLIDHNSGRLQARLPFGIYKIKTRVARSVKEKVFLLDENQPDLQGVASVPVLAAAPLPATVLHHEYHEAAAVSAPAVDVVKAPGAAITVMARVWTQAGHPAAVFQPWLGVKIVDEGGKTVADLERDGTRDTGGDPFAVCSLSVRPGIYFLRQHLANRQDVEQSLVVPENWHLRAFILRVGEPGRQTLSPYPRVSLMMHRTDRDFRLDDPARKGMEIARVALADERAILDNELEALLLLKFEDPVAGIIGGHLLLIENERNPRRDIGLLDEVVKNLRLLVGNEHPDVECLSLRCPDESLRRNTAVRLPPLYQRSWKLLIEASQNNPALVPKKLWDRIQAQSSLPPYLVWASDAESKAASREAIVEALLQVAAAAVPALAGKPAHAELLQFGRALADRPEAKPLKKAILAAAAQAASRLQVPPSVIKSFGNDLISKDHRVIRSHRSPSARA
jgi:hypothetical protein